jgi:hypothetical protein
VDLLGHNLWGVNHALGLGADSISIVLTCNFDYSIEKEKSVEWYLLSLLNGKVKCVARMCRLGSGHKSAAAVFGPATVLTVDECKENTEREQNAYGFLYNSK